MTISFDIPAELDERLKLELGGDLNGAAKEAFAIELYRQARISAGELGMMLNMTSSAAAAWLGRHGVEINYSLEDLEADRRTLDELFSGSGSE